MKWHSCEKQLFADKKYIKTHTHTATHKNYFYHTVTDIKVYYIQVIIVVHCLILYYKYTSHFKFNR